MRSDREKRRKGSADSDDTFSSIDSHSRLHRDDRDDERRRRGRDKDEEYTSDRRHRREPQDSHDDDRDRYERRQRREERRARRDKRERRERRGRREQRERARDEQLENPFDSPPPYDDDKPRKPKDKARPSPKRTSSQDQGEEEEAAQPNTDRVLSKLERIGGPFIYIIPLLTAFCLLAASTCSADWWRKDVNVIRLGLPGDVYARLLATGNNLGKGGGEAVVDSGGKVQERAAKISPAGWLSVGFWGWCVCPEGDGP